MKNLIARIEKIGKEVKTLAKKVVAFVKKHKWVFMVVGLVALAAVGGVHIAKINHYNGRATGHKEHYAFVKDMLKDPSKDLFYVGDKAVSYDQYVQTLIHTYEASAKGGL